MEGRATRRPGTYFIEEIKTSTDKTRLIPFEFSTEQAYVLEFGDEYIRFYKDQARIEVSGSPYEIASPYAIEDVFEIKIIQDADIMILLHPEYPVQKLFYDGDTGWTINDLLYLQVKGCEIEMNSADKVVCESAVCDKLGAAYPQDNITPDPWKNRNMSMKCRTCMWFVLKELATIYPAHDRLGRCRRRAPSMNGYPAVFETDWCGDHKLDETKL